MIFMRKLIPDSHAEWIGDGFVWVIQTFGADTYFNRTSLVLPTKAFLDAPGGTSHETALAVFEQVNAYMGVSEWPCELVRQEESPELRVAEFHTVQLAEHDPGGTFQAS